MSERKSRYELFLEEEEARKKQLTRRCTKCGEVKALSEYAKNKRQRLGTTSWCKQCFNARQRKYKSREDRFWKAYWSKVERVGDCLEWNGSYWNKGPCCRWDYQKKMVRRVVYALSVGELPDDAVVFVRCNNHRCVRQSHLELGTKEELEVKRRNSAATGDKNGSRLHPDRHARGECSVNAKLNTTQVREIRARFDREESMRSIARSFNVAPVTIERIVKRRTWAHVQ